MAKMTKEQKSYIKKQAIEIIIAVILFTSLLSLGGCISGTAKFDPIPQERLAAEQAQSDALRMRAEVEEAKAKALKLQAETEQIKVEELKIQTEYLKRIAEALEKMAKNIEQ
jgi:cell division protein FtsB